jgi:RNA polymerase sigma-70 factor (ECF subfamily)
LATNTLRQRGAGSSSSPEKLLRSVRDGDAGQLGKLLHLYRNYLNLLADSQLDRKLRARVSPSDIVQESMLEALRDFHQFRGESQAELLAWLRRILVHNLARAIEMHVLAEKRDVRRDVSLGQLSASVEHSTMQLYGALIAQGETPSAGAERHERAVILADAMSELTPEYRDVLVLRNLQGLPFKEVAERTQRSVAATKMLWMRAIKRLRQVYKKREAC